MTRPASQDGGGGCAREAAAPSRLLKRVSRGWRRTGRGREPANGRPPRQHAPRPGLGRAAAAEQGNARAGPGLSLLNLGRRRARAPAPGPWR